MDSKMENSYDNVPHISAFAGDMNFMVPYINAGGPPSHQKTDGNTILHAAVEGWQFSMVEYLILCGADINAQNKYGDTPMHTLVRSNNVPFNGKFLNDIKAEDAREKTFQLLFLKRADLSIKNEQGVNPLHLSSYNDDIFAVKQLLPRVGSIDDLSSKGITALVYAILEEHVEVTKLLISSGANLNFTFNEGITPLRLLYSSDNPELKALADLYYKTK
ncbi:MAG: ankyrin repeat domain-containing protein [Ignavibacteriaceae bacterium]|nr:ankyrin repeat domain-containing protein [Ignavibacteriaceae bacterium]